MYSLSNVGMSYPGLNTSSKVHLFKTICQPTLLYGIDCISMSEKCIQNIQSTQGGIMKQVCGLSKRSHHSAMVQALEITNTSTLISESTKSLFKRICSADSPTRDVCIYFMNLFISSHVLIPGTLIDRIVKMGISPTSLLQSYVKYSSRENTADGVVDSLRAMLYCDNYIKPWSNEYLLVKLLTRF